jgi:hypothetical protein
MIAAIALVIRRLPAQLRQAHYQIISDGHCAYSSIVHCLAAWPHGRLAIHRPKLLPRRSWTTARHPPGASTHSIPLGPPRKKDMRSNTHGSYVSMKKDFVTAADCPFIRKDNPIFHSGGQATPRIIRSAGPSVGLVCTEFEATI